MGFGDEDKVFNLFTFLQTYPHAGYLVVFLGSMIEGEMIVLGASALAAAGCLSISTVALMAFSSTLLVDQLFFFIGRRIYRRPGRPLSERFPKLYRKSKRAVILLKKYDMWFILMFRFVYGIRAISPVVIGLCGIAPRRFIPLNFIAALLWAGISCSVGYWLGDLLFDVDPDHGVVMGSQMHWLEEGLLGILAVILLIALSVRTVRKFRRRHKIRLPGVDPDVAQQVEHNFYKAAGKPVCRKKQ